MKICYIADGQSIHTQRWVKYFANKGHEVHLISYKNAEIENVNFHYISPRIRIPYFSIFGTLILVVLKIRTIKRLIKEINPDIIHGHYLIDPGFYAAASGFKPLVVSAWGSDVLVRPKKSVVSRWITKYVLKRADLIHSVSEYLTEELILLGVDKEKIVTIPFGVDTEKFNPCVDDSEIRKSLGWNDNPIVISTRSFEPIYNIECLINAIPMVIKDIPDAKFIIKGTGHLENKLKNMVEELGISDSVKFVGHVLYEELPSYLSYADVYVSTSLSDGTSVSLLEAMSCGLPVVVTNIEGNKPWIKNGKNGYLFEKKDSDTLAKHIINLIKNKEKSKIFGEKNREIVKKRGDWDKNMGEVEQLYVTQTGNYEKQIRK